MRPIFAALTLGLFLAAPAARADEYAKEDVDRYEKEFAAVAAEGRDLWTSDKLAANGVVCAQCHPNAANTHPETYPKFQKQLGRVAQLWEMVNWCIKNPLEGKAIAADDPKMTAMLAYIAFERRGVKLRPGEH